MSVKTIVTLVAGLSLAYPMLSVANPAASMSHTMAITASNILGTLIVLNNNEIAAGNLAASKTSNKDVKEFALLMVKEHKANLNQTEVLSQQLKIKPVENAQAIKMQDDGKKELAALEQLSGSAFDKAYIQAMVKGHTAALNLVNVLISNASNPMIKAHLEATKIHVEHHLIAAQAIDAGLN